MGVRTVPSPAVELRSPVANIRPDAAIKDLTNQQVIDDYLRKIITPNLDQNRNVYVGVITKIITWKSSDYKVGDIFYNSFSNTGRLKGVVENKDKNVLLFVHIPFFTTNNRINTTEFLHYDTFNKIRVVYEDMDFGVEVGDYVHIVFSDKETFRGASVNKIEKSSLQFKESFKNFSTNTFGETIPSLEIKAPNSTESIFEHENYVPQQGYVFAIKNIFSIIKSINETKSAIFAKAAQQIKPEIVKSKNLEWDGDTKDININLDAIRMHPTILEIYNNSPEKISDSSSKIKTISDNNYLIIVELIITVLGEGNSVINSNFIEFFKSKAEKFGHSIKVEIEKDKIQYVNIEYDVNLNNLSSNKEKTLENYLSVERTLTSLKTPVTLNIQESNVVPILTKAA